MNNYLAIGFTPVLYGVMIIFNLLHITSLSKEQIFSIVLIFFGLLTFLNSFHKLKRGGLFFTAVLMNIGIILFVLANYEVLNWHNVITPSLFYLIGVGLIALYIENSTEKVFIFSAVVFFILSLCSVVFINNVGVVNLINKITLLLFDFWPLFLILFGVILIVGNQRRKLPSTGSSVSTTE